MRVTLREIQAGEGWNEGPELRMYIQANEITTVPRAIASLDAEQAELFDRYRRQPSDFEPFLGHRDGFRFNCEWTFPLHEESA